MTAHAAAQIMVTTTTVSYNAPLAGEHWRVSTMTNYRMCLRCLHTWIHAGDLIEPGDKLEIVPPREGCDVGDCEKSGE